MTLDGLNLDFVRHPPFFGYYDPLVEGFEKDYGQSPLNLSLRTTTGGCAAGRRS